MTENRIPGYRFVSLSMIGISALFALLIIVPFYAWGLHLRPDCCMGAYDPKGFPLFQGVIGNVLLILAAVSIVVMPVWVTGNGIVLSVTVLRYGSRLSLRLRLLAVFALIFGFGLLAFMFSPQGRLILRWFFD